MSVFLYAFMSLMIVGALLSPYLAQKIDAKPAAVAAIAQADQYRMFMMVANAYMATYAGGPGTVTWDMMKTASGMPSGAVHASMPPSWKVKVDTDMTWVACTEMDERALGMVQQLAAPNGLGLNRTAVNGANYIVVGGVADTGKASQCM